MHSDSVDKPQVFLVNTPICEPQAAPGDYLVHTPRESANWTLQRRINAPSPEVLASQAVTRLRRRAPNHQT